MFFFTFYFIADYHGPEIGKNILDQLNEGWKPEENLKIVSELVCGQDPQEAFDKSIDKIHETVDTIMEKQNDKNKSKKSSKSI